MYFILFFSFLPFFFDKLLSKGHDLKELSLISVFVAVIKYSD